MAIIECRECGGKISSEADACPHCGCPNKVPSVPTASSPNVAAPLPSKKKSNRNAGCIFVLCVFGFIILMNIVITYPKRSSVASQASKSTSTSVAEPNALPAVYATKSANIRNAPSTTGSVIRTAYPGERLTYTDKSGEWYKLSSSSTFVDHWINESVVITESEKSYRDRAQIKAKSWSWHEEYGYAVAEGQVTNVSSSPLNNVEAVVTYNTSSGEFITSDSALVEYNPIMPGQTSPWKVLTRWNPAMKKAYVEYKTLMGGALEVYRE